MTELSKSLDPFLKIDSMLTIEEDNAFQLLAFLARCFLAVIMIKNS